jgi:hypothetical protein
MRFFDIYLFISINTIIATEKIYILIILFILITIILFINIYVSFISIYVAIISFMFHLIQIYTNKSINVQKKKAFNYLYILFYNCIIFH